MLIYVVRRAKAVVRDREENYYFYQNIADHRPSVSSCSNASEEDRRDSLRYMIVIKRIECWNMLCFRNDYQVLPDEYLLDHEQPQAAVKRSKSITFKSNIEVNHDSTEKANKNADNLLQVKLKFCSFRLVLWFR